MFEKAATTFAGKTFLEITERLDEYRLVFNAKNITPQTALAQVRQFLELCEKLPSRDRFEFQIEFQGDLLILTNTSESPLEAIVTHFEAHENQGESHYNLIVKKSVNDALSIYCMSAFGRYLEREDLASLVVSLGSRFKDGITFECFCPISPCGSNSIRFWPQGQVPPHDSNAPLMQSMRSQVQTSFRDNSYTAGIKTDLLPSDFYLLQRTEIASINDFMDKACAVLCVVYLANSSQILPPERLSYKLIGYKSVEGDAAFNELVPALNGLYKIFDWAYGVGGSTDRIGLARNVVSLHVDRLQDLSDNSSLWNAIHSNYQIYLKGNVASYLEVKGKITEFLVGSTSKAHALVEDLVDSLKNSVFVMLTFLLTVVVVNGFKDTGLTVIFSLAYFWIVVLLCIVLTVWVVGTCFGAIRRLDNSAQTTAEIMQLGYGRIVLPNEISENIDPITVRNRRYLVKHCWHYALLWILIAVLLICGFGLGYLFLGRTQVVTLVGTTLGEQGAGIEAIKLITKSPAGQLSLPTHPLDLTSNVSAASAPMPPKSEAHKP